MEWSLSDPALSPKRKPNGGYWWDERVQERQDKTLYMEKRGHKFVRYADDCSIFLKSKSAAERVLASIGRFLEKQLHLEAGLGQLLQVRHRVSEAQGFGRMDTLPASLLYLEAMEAAQTQAAGLSSTGRGSELGEAFCLLPKGRLGDSLQSDYGHNGNGSTA